MLTDTLKAPKEPRVHIIPFHGQGRTTLGPIYQKYTFLINVSYLLSLQPNLGEGPPDAETSTLPLS